MKTGSLEVAESLILVGGLQKNRAAYTYSVGTWPRHLRLGMLLRLPCTEDKLSFSMKDALFLILDQNRILTAGICMVHLSWSCVAMTLGLLLLKTMDRGIDNLNFASS